MRCGRGRRNFTAATVIVLTGLTVAAGVFVGVFTLSGVSKVRHPYAAATAIHQFGVLSSVRPLYGRLLGALELALALGFVFAPANAAPFAVAACLLAVFAYFIARALAGGHRFACACFGDSHEELSRPTFIRTGLLFVVAVVATVGAEAAKSSLTWRPHVEGLATGVLLVCAVFISVALLQAQLFSPRLDSDA